MKRIKIDFDNAEYIAELRPWFTPLANSAESILTIKRKDGERMTFGQIQYLKNLMIGEERFAVQIFPKQSKLVDFSNCYHLFVFPEGYQLGCNYQNNREYC